MFAFIVLKTDLIINPKNPIGGRDVWYNAAGKGFRAMRLEKIGKYDVVRVLGKGSTGKVYKAFDPIIDRFVALKVIPGEIVSQPEHLQRFKKEVKAQGRVLHPNVATIFDVDFSDGNYVIVMEYVEGRSLRDLMQAERILTLKLFYRIISQACAGLSCAHKQGVIHRDIKPENICLTSEGRVKILDFSIAKLQSSTTSTGIGFLLGSAYYMAPEQIQGLLITPAADQFALGVIAYEMLAGKRPFQGRNVADTILSATQQEPPLIGEVNPMVDEELELIIRVALAKEPHRRYPSVARFGRALRDYFGKVSPAVLQEESPDD